MKKLTDKSFFKTFTAHSFAHGQKASKHEPHAKPEAVRAVYEKAARTTYQYAFEDSVIA
jgi:hypothetical protein